MKINSCSIKNFTGTINSAKATPKSRQFTKTDFAMAAIMGIGVATLAAYYLIGRKSGANLLNRVTDTLPEEIFNKKCMGSDFLGVLKRRNSEDTLFCLKNSSNTLAQVNLHENSLLGQFKIVPIITDAEAEQRLTQVTQEFQELARKRFNEINRQDISVDTNDLIGLVYDYIRAANYKVHETINASSKNLHEAYQNIVTKTNNDFVRVKPYESWIYHLSANNAGIKSKYRMSLNAKIDDDFIKTLDDYIKANNLQVKYKIPCSLGNACKRTDTYNIYFPEEPTQKIKDDICKLAEKYIRSDEGIGTKFAKGVYGQQEPSGEDIRDFIKICCAMNPYFYENTCLRTFDIKYFAKRASAGQIEACKLILEKILSKVEN